MSEKELLNGLPPYLFGAVAMISFVLALYLAFQRKCRENARKDFVSPTN